VDQSEASLCTRTSSQHVTFKSKQSTKNHQTFEKITQLEARETRKKEDKKRYIQEMNKENFKRKK
jgi:hypothetical protein